MSTPDRTPEQQEPDTRQRPQNPLENEGWGTTDPANPFTEEVRTVPWFRRPAMLIGSAAVAVVVVGLVIALVVTGKDAESTEAGSTSAMATTTPRETASVVDSTYPAATDSQFLASVDPLLRLYTDDDDLFTAAAVVCNTPKLTSKETGKFAIIVTAQQIAKWKGIEGPTEESSTFSMAQSLADDSAEFVLDAEAAYCPGEVNDGSSELM